MSLLVQLPVPVFQIHSSLRTDRAALTDVWTRQHGVNVNHFEATMDANGRRGCALSHKGLAKSQTGVYLVLEDDAVPTRHVFDDVVGLADLLDAIRKEAFDVIYLGGLPMFRHTSTPWTSLQSGACWCTHAMIVGERGREWFAAHEFNETPIDVELASAALRFAWTRHEWFAQAPGASDVNRSTLTRSALFQTALTYVHPAWRAFVLHRFVSCVLLMVLAFFMIYCCY